jgi:hypothetical protein
MLRARFSEPAMHKVLIVALLTACLVNVACLCSHLSSRLRPSTAHREWMAGPSPAMTVRTSLL